MRLDTRALGIAAGLTAAVLFTLCSVAVAVAPDPTTAFFGYLTHMDLTPLPRVLTVGSFVVGLIGWAVGTGLTFALAAAIYNRLAGMTSLAAGPVGRPAEAHRI